jgi:hypothetical protein
LHWRQASQKCRRSSRVAVKQLVKIAYAVMQQGVEMLCLDAQVLLHDWRMAQRAVFVIIFSNCQLAFRYLLTVAAPANRKTSLSKARPRHTQFKFGTCAAAPSWVMIE